MTDFPQVNWTGLRAFQELLPLPAPFSPPSPSQTEPQEAVVNAVNVEEDDPIAPRDINLAFDAQYCYWETEAHPV